MDNDPPGAQPRDGQGANVNQARMSTFHPDIQDFSDTFIALQVQRHEADYNPNPVTPLTRTQTMRNIQRTRDASTPSKQCQPRSAGALQPTSCSHGETDPSRKRAEQDT